MSALANYTFDHIETPKPTIAQTGWKPDTHTLREAMWEDENTTVVMLDCVSGYVTCYIPDTGQIEHVKDIDIVPSDTQYSVVKNDDGGANANDDDARTIDDPQKLMDLPTGAIVANYAHTTFVKKQLLRGPTWININYPDHALDNDEFFRTYGDDGITVIYVR